VIPVELSKLVMAGKVAFCTLFVAIFMIKITLQTLQDDIAAQMNATEKTLTRKRRYLIFPEGSSLQLGQYLFFYCALSGSRYIDMSLNRHITCQSGVRLIDWRSNIISNILKAFTTGTCEIFHVTPTHTIL
jgi:hypothetical protein